jgi:hypothetical protein
MNNNTTHILKHKNINVAYLWISEGQILDVIEIKEPEHLPYKYISEKEKNVKLLNNWLDKRGIPFSREDYELIINKYNVKTSKELALLGNGLNLTDHFWLCDAKNEKKWEDVNFLDNKFSSRIGEILPEIAEKYEGFANPDFSSNGSLKKFWLVDGERRMLCKDGSGDIKQEPFNEYIASEIAELFEIDHVQYRLLDYNEKVYSSCECMIDKDVEFVNAFSVFLDAEPSGSKYNDYIKRCENRGIKNAREEVDKMIIVDYLIRNTDRHVGNYGILRNSETLKWEKIAPLFDNGNSLWHDAQGIKYINANEKSNSRSFTGENEKNISLVGDIGWYDKSKINNFDEVIKKALKNNKNMDDERIDRIAGEFKKRVVNLDKSLDQGIGDIDVSTQRKGYRR